jgi:hypothetical protein
MKFPYPIPLELRKSLKIHSGLETLDNFESARKIVEDSLAENRTLRQPTLIPQWQGVPAQPVVY